MDTFTPAERSRIMRCVKGQDTGPEVRLRKLLHAAGYRFRLHADLPGRPDVALPKHRAAVFVHGCFWHRHPGCRRATTPAANHAYWQAKFARNVARDRRVKRELRAAGWRPIVVWECQLAKPEALLKRLRAALG